MKAILSKGNGMIRARIFETTRRPVLRDSGGTWVELLAPPRIFRP